jgi:hypothetical protein
MERSVISYPAFCQSPKIRLREICPCADWQKPQRTLFGILCGAHGDSLRPMLLVANGSARHYCSGCFDSGSERKAGYINLKVPMRVRHTAGIGTFVSTRITTAHPRAQTIPAYALSDKPMQCSLTDNLGPKGLPKRASGTDSQSLMQGHSPPQFYIPSLCSSLSRRISLLFIVSVTTF